MSKLAKSNKLRIQLDNLDAALVPAPKQQRLEPIAAKVIEGTDRVEGSLF